MSSKNQKKSISHHFVPKNFQNIFCKFEKGKNGIYLDLRTGEIEQQSDNDQLKAIGSPKSKMCLDHAYRIFHEDTESSVEVEKIFSVVENQCKHIVENIIIKIDEDFATEASNSIKTFNSSKTFLSDICKFYFFLTLQIYRMPHLLIKLLQDTSKRVELLCEFATEINSHKKFNKRINPYLKNHGFKDYPDIQVTLEQYDQFKNAKKVFTILLDSIDMTNSFEAFSEKLKSHLQEHGIKNNPFSSFSLGDYEHYKTYSDRLFLALELIKDTRDLKEFDKRIDLYLKEHGVDPHIFHTFHYITQETYDFSKQEIQRLILLTQRIHRTMTVEEYNQYSNDLNLTEKDYGVLEEIKNIAPLLLKQLASINSYDEYKKNIESTIERNKITTVLLQHFTQVEFNRIKDIIHSYRPFINIIKQTDSYEDYLVKFNQDLLAKALTQEEYNDYKKIDNLYSYLVKIYIEQLRRNTLFSSFSNNNKDFSIKNILGIKVVQELFNKKTPMEFVKEFCKIIENNENKNNQSNNNISYISDTINFLFREKEILVSKDPVFVLPMVVIPQKCNTSFFYIPISPKIVIKLYIDSEGQEKNIFLPKPKSIELKDIIEANKQFIEQTKLLKDHSIYKELSICIPCELEDWEHFRSSYLPKDIELNA